MANLTIADFSSSWIDSGLPTNCSECAVRSTQCAFSGNFENLSGRVQQYAMPSALANFLTETIEREIPNLRAITEEQSTLRRGEGKWCPREELGHLIDSASNNHIRFVRATLDGEFRGPSYLADDWVRLHGYPDIPWESIVALWLRFNKLLTTLVDRIPDDALHSPCYINTGD